jgi:hypothetical protein
MARSQNSLLKTQHWQDASITDKVWQSFMPDNEKFLDRVVDPDPH